MRKGSEEGGGRREGGRGGGEPFFLGLVNSQYQKFLLCVWELM